MEEHGGLWGPPSHIRMGSSSSTPFESAACSPRSTDKAPSSFYSVCAPTHPLTITCDIRPLPGTGMGCVVTSSDGSSHEEPSCDDFDFSARFSETDPPWSCTPMSSADELFYKGQIRPLWYNCEDVGHFSSNHGKRGKNDDEENDFDFRSSADYKFSMFSTAHSATFTKVKAQRSVGYGYNGHSLDDCSVGSNMQVSKDSKEDTGELESTKNLVQNWRAATKQGHDEMIAKQALMVNMEGSRGRFAGGNRDAGIRRSRSLSPLRVFHMDDELPRHSVKTSVDEQEEEKGIQVVKVKGRRLTLKELLHSSSRTEHTFNQKQGEKMQNKPFSQMDVEKNVKGDSAFCLKCSARLALDRKLKGANHASQHLPGHQVSMSSHGLHYASHSDQTRQQTFLPYKHGLLGCLGITSKSYRSAAGLRTFHSKSGVTRRSAGNGGPK